ncbi:hypothetical protein KC19_5G055400 [Ceratodon purpureus]|uniref:Glycosyl transferase 64 domain-containing protein n=1 Tax=Ceratodon purpureus TaxID=3225 RepID=A0A8T0HYZ2_CERPU|nr:hypothetical protein KC19_5G055400 [Ceratodon purpureus]
MGEAGRTRGRSPGWSFKIWILFFEAGLGSTVLLVMLGLWWAALEETGSVVGEDSARGVAEVRLGHGVCERELYPRPWELRSDQLTILVNGFIEARLPLLQASLRTYSASPAVHSVFVLWGNISTPDSVLQGAKLESMGAPIYIVRQLSTSLNDRFLPRRHVKTKAVMICDDDITVDSKSLEFALKVWRENQQRIVGFFPRAHSYQLETHSWIYTKNQNKYSIMLTKIMILATDYLYRYSCEMPAGVHEYVDKGMNCEDIAMNFLVSNFSGSGPLLVEGQPRDWGDTRNSAEELTSMGLSARADHRKDRGDCILQFQRLWNGMELRFSYAKAVRDVDEQVNCEKFGELIDCDESASSVRDAKRHAGHHRMKRSFQYAYVTLIQSKVMYYAALVWAQALRNTGTVHDLVLLLDVKSGLKKGNDTLRDHFDVVKEVGGKSRHKHKRSVGKLSAWQLWEYERVVYMDLNLLCLSNLDHLFALPEPAAAPLTTRPQEFHTGLLVLQPSNTTFTELLQWMESMSKADRRVEHRPLNGFFQEWFQTTAQHRLPMRLNMPVQLTPISNASAAALPGVLQYPKKELVSLLNIWMKREGLNQTSGLLHQENMTDWFAVWLEILGALRSNKYQPLDDEIVSHLAWKPSNGSSSTWPPKLKPLATRNLTSLHAPPRKAFVTVLTSADHLPAVAGWTTTYSRFHLSTLGHESLLLVDGSVDRQAWQPFETFFDSIVVVGGSSLSTSSDVMSATLLHLWNQTNYDKLVYVDPSSIFLSNCDFLMELEPFAAAADYILPDTFSLQVMVIQPDNQRFLELSKAYLSIATSQGFSVVRFLNEHHRYWYPSYIRHRIAPIFNAESDLQRGAFLDVHFSWRILALYSSDLLDPAAETAALWRRYVCNSMHTRAMDLLTKYLHVCNPTLYPS